MLRHKTGVKTGVETWGKQEKGVSTGVETPKQVLVQGVSTAGQR